MRIKSFTALALPILWNLVPAARADHATRATQQATVASSEANGSAALESASLLLLGSGLSLAGWALKRLRQPESGCATRSTSAVYEPLFTQRLRKEGQSHIDRLAGPATW